MNKIPRFILLLMFQVLICVVTKAMALENQETSESNITEQSIHRGRPGKSDMERASCSTSANPTISKNVQIFQFIRGHQLNGVWPRVRLNFTCYSETNFTIKGYLAFIYPSHNFW